MIDFYTYIEENYWDILQKVNQQRKSSMQLSSQRKKSQNDKFNLWSGNSTPIVKEKKDLGEYLLDDYSPKEKEKNFSEDESL